MPKLTIKGWETGINRIRMTDLLIEKLMLQKEDSEAMLTAVSAGNVVNLVIEEVDVAKDLYTELLALGVFVEFGE